MDTTTLPSPKSYLLLLRNTGPETYAHLSSNERSQFLAQWNAWFDDLVSEGKALEGEPLEVETRVVSGVGGTRVVDGPYAEAKEAIGGYIKILARDLEEATAIAKRHPMLAYGMQIEIRPLVQQCHLGVQGTSARAAASGSGTHAG